MKYVVDKNTNRMIYQVPSGGKFLVDAHSYLVEAAEFTLEHPAWNYRWVNQGFVFVPPKVAAKPIGHIHRTGQSGTNATARKGRVVAKPMIGGA